MIVKRTFAMVNVLLLLYYIRFYLKVQLNVLQQFEDFLAQFAEGLILALLPDIERWFNHRCADLRSKLAAAAAVRFC